MSVWQNFSAAQKVAIVDNGALGDLGIDGLQNAITQIPLHGVRTGQEQKLES